MECFLIEVFTTLRGVVDRPLFTRGHGPRAELFCRRHFFPSVPSALYEWGLTQRNRSASMQRATRAVRRDIALSVAEAFELEYIGFIALASLLNAAF